MPQSSWMGSATAVNMVDCGWYICLFSFYSCPKSSLTPAPLTHTCTHTQKKENQSVISSSQTLSLSHTNPTPLHTHQHTPQVLIKVLSGLNVTVAIHQPPYHPPAINIETIDTLRHRQQQAHGTTTNWNDYLKTKLLNGANNTNVLVVDWVPFQVGRQLMRVLLVSGPLGLLNSLARPWRQSFYFLLSYRALE